MCLTIVPEMWEGNPSGASWQREQFCWNFRSPSPSCVARVFELFALCGLAGGFADEFAVLRKERHGCNAEKSECQTFPLIHHLPFHVGNRKRYTMPVCQILRSPVEES